MLEPKNKGHSRSINIYIFANKLQHLFSLPWKCPSSHHTAVSKIHPRWASRDIPTHRHALSRNGGGEEEENIIYTEATERFRRTLPSWNFDNYLRRVDDGKMLSEWAAAVEDCCYRELLPSSIAVARNFAAVHLIRPEELADIGWYEDCTPLLAPPSQGRHGAPCPKKSCGIHPVARKPRISVFVISC